jgi:hypothetical protein
MKAHFECHIEADQDAIFGTLADVLQHNKEADTLQWAVKVSVNPSRFGVDEAISVRQKDPNGEGEIGKLLIRPLRGNRYLLVVPKNRTGGAAPPELDPEGRYFDRILTALLERLAQLGLYTSTGESKAKEPAGSRRRE